MVDVLTDSFLAYPEHVLMWGSDRKINRTLMEATVANAIANHRVWLAETKDDIVGVGLWTDPGAVWISEEDVPAVFGSVMGLVEPEFLQFMLGDMLPGQAGIEEKYIPGCATDSYFGAILGVDPKAQSCGVGGKIMADIIKNAGDVPIMLHTQGPKNLHFYGKYGFKVAAKHEFVLLSGETWLDNLLVRRPDGSV
ncbi:hypothetical protein CcaverHIS002_0504800 [Cutaneotrichosporon cavernicola]|uniref:N-acetyltransferase domain-containing protein n=1 Tax=Cutaneotrichosporon cavernicola TaxID=279322 RepID=A0AA48L6N0_9TREE|nr:uncharacterized protein CcaverHIS019_0505340 [Cutaneotrichosporon cavernicola]BEI85079.1 hypothetical protein CcaverHIS002_0504800 [Cutaneotrichosporon cavernicola]BEI92906.1 hypothetical protein CcaverHIS019_0505340 [Cutaneotrichosporon cavernicola]BEJ00682.1 hypothetical protein CcaverHIS631_0505390 [Cutaneotrichosporon cavernicola]BEJ08449.1 hypothetical protein CcaverHIS641_0505430 [Cutaneotrichosporon cavernicola]